MMTYFLVSFPNLTLDFESVIQFSKNTNLIIKYVKKYNKLVLFLNL